MRKNISIWMLGIAAVLASCSSEDMLQTDNNNDKNTVTFTATLDDGMITRATGDDDNSKITRAIVEVYEDAGAYTMVGERVEGIKGENGFTFTIPDLVAGKKYTFLFWADDWAKSSYNDNYIGTYNADNLKSITQEYATCTLAYSLATTLTPEEISQNGVQLKHAVTKITLQITADVEPGTNIYMKLPQYRAFNVLTNSATGDFKEVSYLAQAPTTGSTTGFAAGDIIISQYLLGIGEVQQEKVTLLYGDRSVGQEFTNLPLNPNKHIILKGDVTKIGLTDANFTATLDESWEEEKTTEFPETTNDVP